MACVCVRVRAFANMCRLVHRADTLRQEGWDAIGFFFLHHSIFWSFIPHGSSISFLFLTPPILRIILHMLFFRPELSSFFFAKVAFQNVQSLAKCPRLIFFFASCVISMCREPACHKTVIFFFLSQYCAQSCSFASLLASSLSVCISNGAIIQP